MPVEQRHWDGPDGAADGGQAFGPGFAIAWQRGPTRGPAGSRNGAYVTEVLEAVEGRLRRHQEGAHACPENAEALEHLGRAIEALDRRTRGREARGVEGTAAL